MHRSKSMVRNLSGFSGFRLHPTVKSMHIAEIVIMAFMFLLFCFQFSYKDDTIIIIGNSIIQLFYFSQHLRR